MIAIRSRVGQDDQPVIDTSQTSASQRILEILLDTASRIECTYSSVQMDAVSARIVRNRSAPGPGTAGDPTGCGGARSRARHRNRLHPIQLCAPPDTLLRVLARAELCPLCDMFPCG